MRDLIWAELFRIGKRVFPFFLLLYVLVSMALMAQNAYSIYRQSKNDPHTWKYPIGTTIYFPPATASPGGPSGGGIFIGGEKVEDSPSDTQNSGWEESPSSSDASDTLSLDTKRLTFPFALDQYYTVIMSTAQFVAVILGAVITGSEYKWRTLKQAIAKGAGRARIFWARYFSLGITLGAIIIGAVALALIITAITNKIYSGTIDWSFLSAGFFGHMADSISRLFLILSVYMSIGEFLGTIFRSTAIGVTSGIILVYFEGFLVGYQNTGVGAAISRFTVEYHAAQFSAPFYFWNSSEISGSPWQSGLILVLVLIFFLTASFMILQRQELTA